MAGFLIGLFLGGLTYGGLALFHCVWGVCLTFALIVFLGCWLGVCLFDGDTNWFDGIGGFD
jgi:hypothetical protein